MTILHLPPEGRGGNNLLSAKTTEDSRHDLVGWSVVFLLQLSLILGLQNLSASDISKFQCRRTVDILTRPSESPSQGLRLARKACANMGIVFDLVEWVGQGQPAIPEG